MGFLKFPKLKPGELLMIFGVAGLVTTLVSNLPMVVKAILFIITIAIIIFGVLCETPVLEYYNVTPEGVPQQSFEDD